MNITININGVATVKKIPVSWHEVTFGTFMKLTECGDDYAKVFAVLTGIDEKIILSSKTIVEGGIEPVIVLLEFLKTECPSVVPETILGYKVPENLGLKTWGQYTDLKDELKQNKKLTSDEALKKYMLYCAIYACEDKHGEYDWEKAKWMANEFLEAPSPEVLGIGNFTLQRSIELNYGINPGSHRRLTRTTKYKQVLKNLPQILGITQLSSIWRKRRPSTDLNS